MGDGVDGGELESLRASDADRNKAMELLQGAIGAGTLALDEFSGRADRVLAAQTRGQLADVLGDLPGVSLRDPAPLPDPPALTLRTTNGRLRQKGAWEVPCQIVARAGSAGSGSTSPRRPASTTRCGSTCRAPVPAR